MPRHGPRRGGGKRPHDHRDRREEEESVDDLAVASLHAAAAAAAWCGGEQTAGVGPAASSTDEDSDEGSSDNGTSGSDDDESTDGDGDDGDGDGSKGDGEGAGDAAAPDPTPAGDGCAAEAEGRAGDGAGSDANGAPPAASAALIALSAYDSDDDGESDVDLAEQLARMEGEDDAPTKRRGVNNKNGNCAPRTEHEIDPYSCPADRLEKLTVGSEQNAKSPKTSADGAIAIDAEIGQKLAPAGTIRSHIAEQRTVVVDSVVPFHLQGQSRTRNGSGNNTGYGNSNGNGMGSALDEGSVLVLLTKQINGQQKVVSLNEAGGEGCTLQVLGKIAEVFGPVQRPLYAIRLPDPPKANGDDEKADGGDPARNADEIELEDGSEGETKDGEAATEEGTAAEPAAGAITDEPSAKHDEGSKMDGDGESKEAADDSQQMPADTCETKTLSLNEAEEAAVDDPWSPDGTLTATLASCPHAPIYSLRDRAKLIDTDQIIQVSGRGCDASNMYDEEAGPGEQYYSDDEQERQARRGNQRNKPRPMNEERGGSIGGRGGFRGGRGRGRGRGGRGGGPPQHCPQQQPRHRQWQQQAPQHYQNQFPPSQMRQAPPNSGYPYAQGHGSHQQGMMQPHQQYPPQYYPPQPYPQAYHGGQQYQYAPNGMGQAGWGAPPPPPPTPGGAARAYAAAQQPMQNPQLQPQVPESDTVYYDYAGS